MSNQFETATLAGGCFWCLEAVYDEAKGVLSVESGYSNGHPTFEIESLQIGQQVIPNILLSQAEAWLNQFISEKINEQTPGLEVMNINISNGLITISGMR